jgi:uncharacterized protein YgfB (UPF0149 family)
MADDTNKDGPLSYEECEKIVRAEVREAIKDLREISRKHFDPEIIIDEDERKVADKELEEAMTRRFLIMMKRRGMVDLNPKPEP